MGKVEISKYRIENKDVSKKKFVIVSDLHSKVFGEIKTCVENEKPDALLIIGDLIDSEEGKDDWTTILSFMKIVSKHTQIYLSLGNHEVERKNMQSLKKRFEENGVHVLDDEFVQIDDIYLFGFSSLKKKNEKKIVPAHLKDAERLKKTIVMCHKPMDYVKYLKDYLPMLTLAGHAHGGQWRIFGRGIFAPDEGLFPKYTRGFYFDKNLLVSNGMANPTSVPRINNNPEIIVLDIN